MSTSRRVLVVVAHPDDETFGCGATIAKLSDAGHHVSVLLPTHRTDPRGVREWAALLEGFHKACAVLGATAAVADATLPESEAERDVRLLHDAIVDHVAAADLVLTHWRGDSHQLHRALSDAVEVATRPFRRRRDVQLFEVPTSSDQGFGAAFPANHVVVLERSQVERKLEAAALYGSELDVGRRPEDLERRLQVRGAEVGAEWAEAFVIARQFG